MIQEHELRQMYINEKMSTMDIAKEVGVSDVTVCRWMKSCGIKTRTQSESHLINAQKPTKEELEYMYLNKKMTPIRISEVIGVHRTTVYTWLIKYEIGTRTMSEARIGKYKGEKNSNWQGGISFEPYCNRFNNDFKEAVRKRDNYICQLCGYEQKPDDQKLDVHHIHYDKENCYPDVVALCRSCNASVNGNRDYWEQYFENQLSERGLTCWSITRDT